MPQFQKGMKKTSRLKPLPKYLKSNQYAHLNEMQYLVNQILSTAHLISSLILNSKITIENQNSQIGAMRYQLENILMKVLELSNLGNQMQFVIDQVNPAVMSIQTLNIGMKQKSDEILEQLVQTKNIIQDFNAIAEDPVLNRVIDELREISERF